MDEFVTIATFTYPSELVVIQGRLEAEGIECYAKDEYTVQVHNFLSNAIGGIKLQVKQSDVEKATEILKDAGVLKEEESVQPSRIWTSLDNYTTQVPLINRMRLELRLIVLIALILTAIFLLIFWITRPSAYESLTQKSWCVDYVTYKGKNYKPYSNVFRISGLDMCNEGIYIHSNGKISFPGFNSRRARGEWTFDNEVLRVNQIDTFQNVYQGVYNIDVSMNTLTLRSDKTTIYCYKTRF